MSHDPDNYYEYVGSGMIVCGECLDSDLKATADGDYTGDERVHQGMFTRLKDDRTEAYQCDSCGKQNAAYEELGED